MERATLVKLALVLGAALGVPAMWSVSREELPPESHQRTLEDSELDWRCSEGHVFQGSGQMGSRACPICGGSAFPFAEFSCSVHGPYRVEVAFARDEGGAYHIARVRLIGQEWVSAEDGALCPLCERVLVYKRRALSRKTPEDAGGS